MRYSYKKALGVITEWAEKEGYEITFDHTDVSQIDWERNSLNIPYKIKIQGDYSIEFKVYLLLHELGHHQLRKDWDRFTKKLPNAANAEIEHFNTNDKKYKRRLTYTVACMEEEFKAWEEGFKLGEKLGIKINYNKWDNFKAKCLMSYMRYYGSKVN